MAKNDFSDFYFEKVCVKSNNLSLVDIEKNSTNKEAQLVNAFNKCELLTEILLKNGFNLNFVAKVQNNIASLLKFIITVMKTSSTKRWKYHGILIVTRL
jgi:adenine-specific DNA-methyltransferase